jgi:hypothetical protein
MAVFDEHQNVIMGAAGAGGYSVDNSIVLDDGSSQYLTRTPSAAGNLKTFTVSFWFKRGNLGIVTYLLKRRTAGFGFIRINADDTLTYYNEAGGVAIQLITTQVFRDPHSWYHLVVVQDTTQATASDRAKMYLNGSEITAFNTAQYNIAQNGDGTLFDADTLDIGQASTQFWDGYLSEYCYIDGQTLTPTSFGEYDTNGIWRPIDVSGLTFGTNGFYLDFAASGDLGNDVSGNANDFTTSGAPTQSSDTPTNNSATLTTIDGSGATFSNGNLVVGSNTTNSYKGGTGCIGLAPGSGSWYVEALCTGATGSNKEYVFGAATNDTNKSVAGYFPGSATYSNDDEHGYYSGSGGIVYNGSSSTGSVGTYGDGNTVALRFDMDVTTPTCKFYVNDTLKHTANLTVGKTYYPHFNTQDLNLTFTVNFGTTSFTYTLPTGHLAINTTNLPAPTIADPSAHFQVTTYTGDGVAIGSGGQEINQSGNSTFQPDFVWIKNRSASTADHWAFDAIRGATKYLEISDSTAETTDTESLTSFDADGFTVGSDPFVNNSGDNHVGWQWKANGSGSSNSDGSITSTVSANQTSGFSIVTYTGNGTAGATVGHGLGVAPDMIIVKNRDNTEQWIVYHQYNGGTKYLLLNSTASVATSSGAWNDTNPSSTVVTLGGGGFGTNVSGNAMIMYAFTEVEGFSKFGGYTGNGSTNGSFVYCGFRPALVIIKRTSGTATKWVMLDSARDLYNVTDAFLHPDQTTAENEGGDVDFLSNGFKARANDSWFNEASTTYVFAAFAEHPFGGSGVAPVTAR